LPHGDPSSAESTRNFALIKQGDGTTFTHSIHPSLRMTKSIWKALLLMAALLPGLALAQSVRKYSNFFL
jgi:hypothetical protein